MIYEFTKMFPYHVAGFRKPATAITAAEYYFRIRVKISYSFQISKGSINPKFLNILIKVGILDKLSLFTNGDVPFKFNIIFFKIHPGLLANRDCRIK